jgi:hypothetical protein
LPDVIRGPDAFDDTFGNLVEPDAKLLQQGFSPRTHGFQEDERWRDCLPFHEYFHGDMGMGLGASHQTGWMALVASLIDEWRR